MKLHPGWLGLLSVVAAAHIVMADPLAQPATTTNAATDTSEAAAKDRRALIRRLRTEREATVRARGEIFARIAIKQDYRGEYVLFRDADVTAFLDLKDPQHPRHRPRSDDRTACGSSKALAHILVVPNQRRETIGKTLASDITADDLELTLNVMKEAATLAPRFGIENPKIYIKSPERVGVGYLHVHVVGCRDPGVPYPPALK